jgi:tRNA(fMet)-specific endonuclease VapC
MSFLLDTDICSAVLKSTRLTHRYLQHLGQLHISAITLAELHTWALRRKAPRRRREGIRDLLRDVAVLDVTSGVSLRFGELQAALLDSGQPAPEMDLLIAATALDHNLTLVTRNAKDYANIPGLRCDDWLAP